MVDVLQFLNVLLNSKFESHGEEQDGAVNWWLRVGVGDVHGSQSGFMEVMEVRAVIKEINKSRFSW